MLIEEVSTTWRYSRLLEHQRGHDLETGEGVSGSLDATTCLPLVRFWTQAVAISLALRES
jgi:hypothetical protein